ncbi:MAG: glycosyltransferase family 4 protein [Chloroflexi bacterium]|nr:glycosyltransferase family 4 protein [Chloroflexota bacterium]
MTRTLSIALVTLGDPRQLTGGYLFHQRLAEAAQGHDAHVDFVSFPMLPFPRPALAGRTVFRRVDRSGAQALVLDSIAAAYAAPWLAAGATDLPLVGMLHQPPGGIDHRWPRAVSQAWLDRLAYRRAQRLLVASESLKEQLVAERVPESALTVVPPGRDVADAPAVPPRNPRHGRSAALLCVGNWLPRKGIHSLLEAFARLPPELATLHLAGDDRLERRYGDTLRARIARSDLRDRVVVWGPISRERVAGLYAAADIFVLPSLREPYGTAYGEAMAFGLPVVGWRAGNLPYLADHEREGLLVTPGDLAGLTTALRRLIEDQALRHRLSESARRRALARLTWEQTAKLFFGAVREVAEARRAVAV